jgi:diadenosine tetraphosphatase ApaH/serine/threonine PP2A family protein phosphatase
LVKRAIVSDIHGNLDALEAVLADAQAQGAEKIICLGDIVGYGPDPRACIDRSIGFFQTILGNHDLSAVFDPEGFNSAAEQAIFWTRAQLEEDTGQPELVRRRLEFLCRLPRWWRMDNYLFVHGSARNPTTEYVFPEDTFNRRKMDKLFSLVDHVCFQGHTHVPGVFTTDGRFFRPDEISNVWNFTDQKVLVNVGSVGQPRDSDPRSCYCLWEDDTIEFRRVPYDVEAVVTKIEAIPELDNFLGYRLREGR